MSVIRRKSTCFILQSKIKHLDIKINNFYMYKTKLEESSNKMETFILSNTEKERQAVVEAMNALKSKVDCLKTEKQYKTLEDEMKYLENKLNITISNIQGQ